MLSDKGAQRRDSVGAGEPFTILARCVCGTLLELTGSHGTPQFAELSGSTALPERGSAPQISRSGWKAASFSPSVLDLSDPSARQHGRWASFGQHFKGARSVCVRDKAPGSLLQVHPVACPRSSNRPDAALGNNFSCIGGTSTSPGSSSLSPGSIPPAVRCSRQQHGKAS